MAFTVISLVIGIPIIYLLVTSKDKNDKDGPDGMG